MTAVERLHRMIDELPPELWPDAEERLRGLLEHDDADWEAFVASRREALPHDVTPEEIDADITRELAEVRAEQAARWERERVGHGR